jgi:hypothetical protein
MSRINSHATLRRAWPVSKQCACYPSVFILLFYSTLSVGIIGDASALVRARLRWLRALSSFQYRITANTMRSKPRKATA